MSEPTDPREIYHAHRMQLNRDEQGNTTGVDGAHTFGLNPVSPSKDGVHVHDLEARSDLRLMQSPLTREDIAEQLRNMNPQTVRGYHMREMLGRTPFDRDQQRQQRAEFAVHQQRATSSEQENLRQRCVAIIKSLEHMEVDKDIALIALEKLCGVDK